MHHLFYCIPKTKLLLLRCALLCSFARPTCWQSKIRGVTAAAVFTDRSLPSSAPTFCILILEFQFRSRGFTNRSSGERTAKVINRRRHGRRRQLSSRSRRHTHITTTGAESCPKGARPACWAYIRGDTRKLMRPETMYFEVNINWIKKQWHFDPGKLFQVCSLTCQVQNSD